MLDVTGLGVAYQDKPELFRDLSFQLAEGRSLWLKGPNGCGKTTLLLALCNIIPQAVKACRTGSVILDGEPCSDIPLNQVSPRLSFAFSDPAREFFFTSCEDEIIFTLENLGLSAAEITLRLADASRLLALESAFSQPSATLSFGWQKLAALAIHLAIRPRLLLLDEPLMGLSGDALHRALTALSNYIDGGGMLILAEHNSAVLELKPVVLNLADWKS